MVKEPKNFQDVTLDITKIRKGDDPKPKGLDDLVDYKRVYERSKTLNQ